MTRLFVPRARPEADRGIRRGYPIENAVWIGHPRYGRDAAGAQLLLFRLDHLFDAPATATIWITADQRYRLLVDDEEISRGPDRSDPGHWSFAALPFHFTAGRHTVLVEVEYYGELSPGGQLGLRPGLLLASTGDAAGALDTGRAPWRVARRDDIACGPGLDDIFHVVGPSFVVDGARTRDKVAPEWHPATPTGERFHDSEYGIYASPRGLSPSGLPEQRREPWSGGRIVAANRSGAERVFFADADLKVDAARDVVSGPVTVPADSRLNLLWDLETYCCAYPQLATRGGRGASVEWLWAESLFEGEAASRAAKGQRDAVSGKWFHGFGDRFLASGAADRFTTPWWRCGRFVLLRIRTGVEPLTLESAGLLTTRYPLEATASFSAPGAPVEGLLRVARQTLWMCAHETLFDCPYYEQMMYAADSRVELLSLYADSADLRLPERVLELFDASRGRDGLVGMRHPAREPQLGLTFGAWWVVMLRDFMEYRDAPDALRRRLPGMRGHLEAVTALMDEDGLLRRTPGWPFVDWVAEWRNGVPPCDAAGCSSVENLHYALAFDAAAAVERELGEPAMAARWRRKAERLRRAVRERFWSEADGLVSDDGHGRFSEHAQALALLSGAVPPGREASVLDGLRERPDLARCSAYFRFYLWEAFGRLGRGDLILPELSRGNVWVERGFAALPESPEPSRSDCHGWTAHPLHHLTATIAGIRPAAPGYRRVRVAPQPGALPELRCRAAHPEGVIEVALRFDGGRCRGGITLPPGVPGEFCWRGRTIPLAAGMTQVDVAGETFPATATAPASMAADRHA